MNQSQARILIAAILLFLVAGGILLFRNDLLSLLSRNNNTPQQNVFENNSDNSSTQADVNERIFRTAIFIDGYKVAVNNEAEIIKEFETINIYGRPYIYKEGQTTGQYPLKEIQLAIRAEEAMAGVTPDYGAFTYISLTDSLIQVNMFLSQEMLDDPQLEEIIIKNLYASIYKLAFKEATDGEVEEVANTAYENLSSLEHIAIQKN